MSQASCWAREHEMTTGNFVSSYDSYSQTWGSIHGERANFTMFVLFCINASDSERRRIFHRFSRSTRLSLLRTAPNPKFQQKLAKIFSIFFPKFCKILLNFNEISPEFHQNFRICHRRAYGQRTASTKPPVSANLATNNVRARTLSVISGGES